MSLQQPARRIHVPYLVLVALALTAPAATAQADDAGVYGPAAPEDAGFVRVFNGDPSEAVELPIGPRRYGPVAFGEVTAYRPIRAGVFLLRRGGEEAELVVRPDTYTTVLIGPGEITVVSDERHDDPARAQLVLYNAAAEGDVDLVVVADGSPVFRDVAPGESRARALNAVTVELGLRTGDDVAVDLEPVDLTRGNSFAVFAVSAETGLAARIHEARVVVDD